MVTKKPGNQTIHKISLSIVVYINMDFHNLMVGVVFQNLQSTPPSEHINFYNFSLVPGSKIENRADQEKLHINLLGAGEIDRDGVVEPISIVFNTSFQYTNYSRQPFGFARAESNKHAAHVKPYLRCTF